MVNQSDMYSEAVLVNECLMHNFIFNDAFSNNFQTMELKISKIYGLTWYIYMYICCNNVLEKKIEFVLIKEFLPLCNKFKKMSVLY